jgi:hypothetical protein
MLIFDTPFLGYFQIWKMMHHYAYTNTKLNSPLQQKGNGTTPTIKWTPLKTNTPTISTKKKSMAPTPPTSLP